MLKVTMSSRLATFQLNLSFQVPENQTTVILGESGAGKSTLLRCIAGLLQPQQGYLSLHDTVYYDSTQRIAIPAQARPFGFVFQDYILFPHLTAYENIAFGLRAQHLSSRYIRQQVAKVLDQVQMTPYAQRLPAQLSGGQQQRIALARALALQPQLLLLDEPLSALDVQTRRTIRQELRQILATTNTTTLFVTHHYLDSLFFGQQILVMDHGQLIQQGDQQQLSRYPRSSYVAELVGVNFFQGTIRTIEDQTTCSVEIAPSSTVTNSPLLTLIATLQNSEDADSTMSSPEAEGIQRATVAEPVTTEDQATPATSDEVFIVIEPRSITLHQQRPEGSARNLFQGTIQQILNLETASGEHSGRVRIALQLPGYAVPLIAEVTATSAQRMQLHEGQLIYASCKATEVRAYR
jgi:ABC-type spermidine/putrescine transport systems, ATPase components